MKLSQNLLLAAGLGFALAVGTAWAFRGDLEDADDDPGPLFGRGMGMLDNPGLREKLGLTEEQATKLRALGFDAAKSGLRARTELGLRRLELEELLQQEEPDRTALEQKLRALADAQHAWLRHRVEQRLAFRRVLTPEQRGKLRQMMAERRERRRGHWLERRHGEPPLFGPGRGFGPRVRPESPPPPE